MKRILSKFIKAKDFSRADIRLLQKRIKSVEAQERICPKTISHVSKWLKGEIKDSQSNSCYYKELYQRYEREAEGLETVLNIIRQLG